jgi:beta-lactam-binding protein with PASTA domain/tRNA A-37 threonylcarbamoyl transferase component Bud32
MPRKESNKNKLISRRYKIIKKIASGGMADVFLGTDLKLDRKIAIKILSASNARDKNFVARFKNEAQTLARLSHPSIVQVYDWGEFDDSYFICMEYVEGDSLKDIIEKKGILPPKAVVGYAVQICNALLMAHKNNLIHRDIKPQNILITPEGKVKVTDFGIAKSLNMDVTKTLNIIGTAHYISPEQARGEVLDHRTDIYSLGIVLYEMLTGDVPFRGDSSINISLKHVNEIPVRPSELIENIPPELEKIIMHCLEKNPQARYSTVKELADDLKRYHTGKNLSFSIEKQKTIRTGIFLKKVRSNLAVVLMAVFMAVFLMLFILYSFKYYNFSANAGNTVTVPPIENIPAENAEEIAKLFDLNLIVTDEIFDPEIPSGFIIEQTPGPGENITTGSNVEVIISKGRQIISILTPNLVGLTMEEASDILEECGLVVGDISKNYSSSFEKNVIINQKPVYNEQTELGGTVDLTVSKGDNIVIIPNIIGQDYIYASNYLTSLDLFLTDSKAPCTDTINEPGKVIEVIPPPGSEVKANTLVELIISTNEPLVLVPDLMQLNLNQAKNILDLQNISYAISYIDTDYAVQKDLVLGQSPEAEAYMSADSKIILFVGN